MSLAKEWISCDVEPDQKKKNENSSGCDVEPDKKKMKMKMGLEKNSASDSEDEEMMLGNSRVEELLTPGHGDLEVKDEKKKMTLEKETGSSDDELKEEDIEAFNKYRDQVVESGGFDIDYCPPLEGCNLKPVEALKKEDEEYKILCNFSQIAIQKFNEEHKTSYKFVEYVKAVWALAGGIKHYITFEAKEDSDDATTTFQACVLEGMLKLDLTYDGRVLLVRKKSCPSEEDNNILLC